MTRGSSDSKDSIVLRPLEIRSWRISLKGGIVDKEYGATTGAVLTPEIMQKVEESQAKEAAKVPEKKHYAVVKHSLRKRCF